MAALDCVEGDIRPSENKKICDANEAFEYPLFFLYAPDSSSILGHKELSEDDRSEQFIRVCISYIENESRRPEAWPDLAPYK